MSAPPQLTGDLARGEFGELLHLTAAFLFEGDEERLTLALKWTYLGMKLPVAREQAFQDLHS